MHTLQNALRNRRLQVAAAIVVVAVSGISIVVRATLTKGSTTAAVQTSDGPQQKDKPPAHMLVLRPNGFEPAEVSWPKGRFFLAIDNHTGVNNINLLLDREVGGRVKEINLKMRKQRAAGIYDLPPGNYVLTEANHPLWSCRITITPQNE
jgi:hypothetical protein